MKKLPSPVMRKMLLIALLTLTVSFAPAQGIDKNKQITLRSASLTRGSLIAQIEAQSGYMVAYDKSAFDDKAVVETGRTNITLGDALSKMLGGTDFTYSVDGAYIILCRKNIAADNSQIEVRALRTVSGTVTGAEPMENVLVEFMDVDGAKAKTNLFGRFTIAGIPAGNHIVKLTPSDGGLVRYREVRVTGAADPDVTLSMGGEDMVMADAREQRNPSQIGSTAKTTAYFVPNAADHTIRAYADEPKTDYTLIPHRGADADYLPKFGVKTNILYLAAATPNIALEFALAHKWTLDLMTAYNPFQLQKGGINLLWFVQPEVRYWFCQRFERHFVGLHGIYGRFNIGDVGFLTKTFEQNRYNGWGAGAGIAYGYHMPIGKRWAMEFTLGAGYVYLEYDKYRCYECDEFVARKNRYYFGPTKAGISLIYMIK